MTDLDLRNAGIKDLKAHIDATLNESVKCKKAFWKESRDDFFKVADVILDSVQSGKKTLICGNGGSACDALHFSGEWVNRFSKDRRALPCIALNADTPLITCIANDFGYEFVFSRQVEALGQEGDVLIAISTSGNSKNVLKALAAAKEKKMVTVALLGGNGGQIASQQLAHYTLNVAASSYTPRIQETHEWILHSICEYIDLKL